MRQNRYDTKSWVILFIVCVVLTVLAGCASSPYKPVHPVTPDQIRLRINEIKGLYEDCTPTSDKELFEAYKDLYVTYQTSTYKKEIYKTIFRPMRYDDLNYIIWTPGLFFGKDFMKKKKFSSQDPGLVLVGMYWLMDSNFRHQFRFIDYVSLALYKELLGIGYVGYTYYAPNEPEVYRASLAKTLKNSDIEERNACFLISYGGRCTVVCSEGINLHYEFSSPCWSQSVFDYLKANVFRQESR